jgi:hypothetical protein
MKFTIGRKFLDVGTYADRTIGLVKYNDVNKTPEISNKSKRSRVLVKWSIRISN